MPGKKNESIPESDYLKEKGSHLPHDPPCTMTFHDKDDKQVGRLEWFNGLVKFHGDLEVSASLFFKYLTETMVNPYLQRKIRKIIAVLNKMKGRTEAGAYFDEGHECPADHCIEALKKEFKV